ncbi:biotin transport system permease protein [Loktanella fryxellensis]|uniref:Biotin transport system permease protein n=1 Tax=Loktanella fryxellensis TaxID=245187 RepID=A0A1H8G592_9RHOB|nr:energy-coupling factor transporter transmembrane component T [Loktanella fryxellensis]SEN39186.1 biotin transport system permease protein [Loktanella fryxellensis]
MISLTSPVRTGAHGWPAGVKLAALCVATVVLFARADLAFQLTAAATTLAVTLVGGWTFARAALSALWRLWPFVVLVVLWHGLTGAALDGAVIALRLLTAFLLANLVTMTTTLSQMIAVVMRVAAPLTRLGVNTRALALGMALVVRFTPVLTDKGTALTDAWRARSHRRPGWRIVIPFAVLAIDDAEHMAEALRARGGTTP